MKFESINKSNPIYYSRFQFCTDGEIYERVVCNISYKELSYLRFKMVPRPGAEDAEFFCSCRPRVFTQALGLCPGGGRREGRKTAAEIEEMKPYINAWDFEPYRNREMEMFNPGFVGYLDGIHSAFEGITDSYLPYIKLSMDYCYEPMLPPEALYSYIMDKYFP